MADQLATPQDLASLLQQDLDLSTATLLIEMATAIVQQAAGGQRIVQVVGESITIAGYADGWLPLPQLPVTAVSAVSIDGTALTAGTGYADYKLVGDRLWRAGGWQTNYGWPWPADPLTAAPSLLAYAPAQPSTVAVTYTHGYPAGDQRLQLARSAVLALAKAGYANPSGATSVHIDDYSEAYDAMASRMEASSHLKAALAKQYGRRAGLARIG